MIIYIIHTHPHHYSHHYPRIKKYIVRGARLNQKPYYLFAYFLYHSENGRSLYNK